MSSSFKYTLILLFATLVGTALSECTVPTCELSTTNQTEENLHPHTNPYKFWQCAPSTEGNLWKPVEKDCALGGVVFSASQERCVWVEEWDQTCQDNPTTTTEGAPTQPSYSSTTVAPVPTSTQAPVECCTPLDCSLTEVAKLPECPHTYGKSYREYYRECVDGKEVTEHCPHKPGAEQLLFNYYIQSCVHPKNFEEACH